MQLAAGIVLGIGLGGFLDGIALHQIAHWHNMGSAILPPSSLEAMKTNMRWDGYFHAATWVITALGVYLLWRDGFTRAAMPPLSAFLGQLLLGWGVFNLVEGTIDHHLLGLHHVRDLPVHVPIYDWLFLAIGGVGLIVLGGALSRTRRSPSASRPRREAA
jgi:uncharacterized membrane protein